MTARELAKELNSSSRPIFTVFKNMDELYNEVQLTAIKKFRSYVERCYLEKMSIKKIGMKIVLFAKREPKLFQFLFMQDDDKQIKTFADMLSHIGITMDMCVAAISNDYGLSVHDAEILFQYLWVYTFSLATLCATKACCFSEEELRQRISMEIQAIMLLIETGRAEKI